MGTVGSVLLYQTTWKNSIDRRFHFAGSLVTFLKRPWPWLLHIPICILSCFMSWDGLPKLKFFTCVTAGIFSIAAIGRWGAVDLRRFFLFDRILVLIFCVGLWFSPIFFYPLLLTGCCLQYIVSGSSFSPGYSNLLGFEFIRSSLCMIQSTLLVQACLQLLTFWDSGFRIAASIFESQVFVLVLCGQAGKYVPQALAKCAIGEKWYSWIYKNRVECLFVNAYLRGWGGTWFPKKHVLFLAQILSQIRVLICAATWMIELSWILILVSPRFTIGILTGTLIFHLVVWLLTGLAGYHYIMSHGLMIMLISKHSAIVSPYQTFINPYFFVGVLCVLGFSAWVLFLRYQLFKQYTENGNAGPWNEWIDPSDHLMSWWDGPYMRMYSFRVVTRSGQRFKFPVTKFAPYDTFVTDIHTYIMILGREFNLDPYVARDRALIRTGVWGLTLSISDRNRLYKLMDNKVFTKIGQDCSQHFSSDAGDYAQPYPTSDAIETALTRETFIEFFQGLNNYQLKWWFPILLFWPHFPGEDMVSDNSPIASEHLPTYKGSEPISEVEIDCVKTFYHRNAIEVFEERLIAQIPIPTAF